MLRLACGELLGQHVEQPVEEVRGRRVLRAELREAEADARERVRVERLRHVRAPVSEFARFVTDIHAFRFVSTFRWKSKSDLVGQGLVKSEFRILKDISPCQNFVTVEKLRKEKMDGESA